MKVNLQDLKLLIDVAYHEGGSNFGFSVGHGFNAACERLIKMGLLMRNPSQPKNTARVALTRSGESFARHLETAATSLLSIEGRLGKAEGIR